jgi:heptose I phosphotransferase
LRKKERLALPALWLEQWKHLDIFEHVIHLEGCIFRAQPGRKTLRFIHNNEAYFIKIHTGPKSGEILKNLLHARLPVMGAGNELEAISTLKKYGFVPQIAGYGFRPPVSFIITKELGYTVSLEDFCRDFKRTPPPLKLKWALIRKVASLAKIIHANGINHRDFYLCHFLLDITGGREFLDPDNLNLYVIDWHRAQKRKRVPLRWQIKDIAGLYFSALDIGLTQRDIQRFVKVYRGNENPRFWQKVKKRALALYLKMSKRQT